MFLLFVDEDGKRHVLPLAGRPSLTFGRSPEADICIADAKVSKLHAEIRSWDTDYVIKDLNSRNGIQVNGIRTDIAVLRIGDVVKVGGHDFTIVKDYTGEKESSKGTKTIVREVAEEIEGGKKGYRTILREIVQSADTPNRKT